MSAGKAAALAAVLLALPAHGGAAQNARPNLVVPCGAFGILPNAGFESNLSFWDTTAGAAWSPEDSLGSSTSGSVEIAVSDFTSAAIRRCVPVEGGERYMLDVAILIHAQGQAEGKAGIVARWQADANCTQELPDFPASTFLTFAPEWTTQVLTPTAPAEAVAALIELRATKTGGSAGSTFAANLDDAFFAFLGSPGCGDPICSFRGPSSSDALHVLRTSVGWFACKACYCDADGSGVVTASDALTVLKASVELPATLACPVCE